MPYAQTHRIKLYYERAGTGQRLLFLSGTRGDLRHRPRIIDGLPTNDFEVLAYDQRGLGRSEKPAVAYTMGDYADDAAALLDYAGWDQCQVFGVSFGGMVAQEFALRYPTRVLRLVLACTSSGGEGGASFPLHRFASLDEQGFTREVIRASDTRWGSEADGWHQEQLEAQVEMVLRARAQPDSEAFKADLRLGLERQLEARRHHDTWGRLVQLKCPVYLCGANHDGMSPRDNMERLASRISNSQLEFFNGGHGFLLETPGALTRVIEFLQQPL